MTPPSSSCRRRGVKDEVLEDAGKNKPHYLIADGEEGQVASKMVANCMGDLWFSWRAGHRIKHMDKHSAMMMVGRMLRAPGDFVEGDGSAWDGCCNVKVCHDTENIPMYRIMVTLSEHPVFVKHMAAAHDAICNMDALRLQSKSGRKHVIETIRRSGHSATSLLNGVDNAVLWAVAITPEPFKHLSGQPVAAHWHRSAKVDGKDMMVVARDCFEGDDGILLFPRGLANRAVMDDIEATWATFGFSMKQLLSMSFAPAHP